MKAQLRDQRSLPVQVSEVLRARIIAGEWAPDQSLPSEQALADEVGVSRPTVRAALRILMSSGLVRVRQGSGTFVTSRGSSVVAGLQELRSTSELIAEQRAEAETLYRKRELRDATKEEEALFDSTEPLRVIAVERCFTSDGEVVAFEWSLVNADVLPADFDPESMTGSIFALLEPMGLLPDQSIANVHAVNDESIAWPGMEPPSPLYLCLTQQAYKHDGRVVSWSQTFFTEGNFEFVLVRTR